MTLLVIEQVVAFFVTLNPTLWKNFDIDVDGGLLASVNDLVLDVPEDMR
jgi:hypothetical protein